MQGLIVSNYSNHAYTNNQLISKSNNMSNYYEINIICLNSTVSTLIKKLVIILVLHKMVCVQNL